LKELKESCFFKIFFMFVLAYLVCLDWFKGAIFFISSHRGILALLQPEGNWRREQGGGGGESLINQNQPQISPQGNSVSFTF
jgi:hypothetical protein